MVESNSAGRFRARLVLAMFLAATSFFIAITFSPLKSGFADAPDRGPGDVQLYRAEVGRIHGGQSYYDVAAAELRQRGYPTRSIFNWRTPLPVWLIGVLPEFSLANAMLGAFAFALLCFSFHLLADEAGLKQAMLAVLLLSGALMPCVLGELVVMSELWSGVLIALSAACFGVRRPALGVLAGVAALFFRELAAPYCLVCVVLAVSGRNYRELAQWSLGLAAYGIFFALHVLQVLPRITPDDIAHANGWICLGGAGFLISTVQMNAYLLLLPQWVTAIYLGCALLGCATWNTPAGRRIGLAIAAYSIAFSLVGHDFNQYWGSLTAPLLCLAASRFPSTIRQLCRAVAPAPWTGRGRFLASQ
jgi:hypothetical protein